MFIVDKRIQGNNIIQLCIHFLFNPMLELTLWVFLPSFKGVLCSFGEDILIRQERSSLTSSYFSSLPPSPHLCPSFPWAPGMPTCLLCTCLGGSVYCDDLKLDSVPPLPKDTTHFYARYNRITKINKSDFAFLSMSSMNIKSREPNVKVDFRRLIVVYLLFCFQTS